MRRTLPSNPTLPICAALICAALGLTLVGCTCEARRSTSEPAPGGPDAAEVAEEEPIVTAATADGPRPVLLVLDPTGGLCEGATRFAAGQRHVVCDRTKEDLSAAALRRALGRLKAERGPAVVSSGAWLLAGPGRAAVARSLAMREPAFFSRLAVWVGHAPASAGLFGPTFLSAVGGQGFRALVLVGPGAKQAETWSDLARRSRVHLVVVEAEAPESEGGDASRDGVWSALDAAFSAPEPPAGG